MEWRKTERVHLPLEQFISYVIRIGMLKEAKWEQFYWILLDGKLVLYVSLSDVMSEVLY